MTSIENMVVMPIIIRFFKKLFYQFVSNKNIGQVRKFQLHSIINGGDNTKKLNAWLNQPFLSSTDMDRVNYQRQCTVVNICRDANPYITCFRAMTLRGSCGRQ